LFYICSNKNGNDMSNLSIETKTQAAIQMVIMDAMEKGHTNASELMGYMKSETFEKAVQNYIAMF
jgi:ribosomal silencing factor RsfS